MAAAAGLAVTLVPVLMGYVIRGRIPSETANPLNRWLIAGYRPLLAAALSWPKVILAIAAAALVATAWPVMRLGGEFMPPMDEGDLLYMPTALPGLSAGKAGELLQQTDRMIKAVPEVARVFGKVGRAETATDPAPMEMIETTIQFKPRSEWRPGMTTDKLVEELDRSVKVPGLSNVWVPPIRGRIDMLATGIKSPVGIKVSGPDLAEIDKVTVAIEVCGAKRARRHVCACRAARRRSLSRHHGRSRRCGTFRRVDRRCARGDRHRDRRREHRRDGRRAGSIPDQRPLPARAARLGGGATDAAGCHRARCPTAAVGDRVGAYRRRSADAEKRKCAALGMGLRRHPRPRSRVGRPRRAGGSGARGEPAVRLLDRVVGPIRVPGTGEGAACVRRAVHAARDLRAALSRVSPGRRGAPHHARSAVRAGGWLLAALRRWAMRRRWQAPSASLRWPALRPSSAW